MARRGPKPEPASVKLAKGNSGRRRIGVDPVPVDVAAPSKVAPPSWLKADALAVWKRLAPDLVTMKLLGPVDVETFGRYCRNFARWLKMQEILDDEGETYESESAHGKLRRANPAFLIADRLDRKLESVEDRFGLNPAERQRIFAARAAAGATGDLFDHHAEPPAGKPGKLEPAKSGSPIGFLN